MQKARFSFGKIFPLFLAILIETSGFGVVYPVFTDLFGMENSPLFAPGTSENVRFFYLGLSFMLFPLLTFLASSFMGDLSDILGRKFVITICIGGLFLSFIIMGISIAYTSLFFLLIGRALSGLMAASIPITLAAVADVSHPDDKAVHMSYVALADTLGFIIGPLFGGILSNEKWGSFFQFSTPFFFFAFLSLICFLLLAFAFKETFKPKKQKRIEVFRFVTAFVDAWKHKPVRWLSLGFFLMQLAGGLYLPLILIYFLENFHYSSFIMGLFNGYLGVWFGVGLLLIVPIAVKFWKIEWIAAGCIFIAALAQIFSSAFPKEWCWWILAIPYAMFIQSAYAAVFTSYSNAVDENSQGWALGISGSIMALSWAITSLSPSLVSVFSPREMIFFGGVLLLVSFGVVLFYCRHYLKVGSIKRSKSK